MENRRQPIHQESSILKPLSSDVAGPEQMEQTKSRDKATLIEGRK
jgi:hypothetical protein